MTSIEIDLPRYLFDDWVVDRFADFQSQNRNHLVAPLRIDFSLCEWVSPLPLLAIATEVMSFSAPDRHIEIDLGNGAGTDAAAANRSRALKYLSTHGFLLSFLSRKDLKVRVQFDKTGEEGRDGNWYHDEKGFQEVREMLERPNIELVYGESIVIHATCWQLPEIADASPSEEVRQKVKDLLKRADSALFRFKTEARKYRDVTLQRLNQILLELVENSAEHAYQPDRPGFVGLYARVRDTRSELAAKSRSLELAHSPLLRNVLLGEKQQQIELFVIDVGRGLFFNTDLWGDHSAPLRTKKDPLRLSINSLFRQPLSRHDRSKASVAQIRSGSTGLMHVHTILSHQNDTTRLITGHEWLAGPHPRPPGFHPESVTSGGYEFYENSWITGTFFHLGISPPIIPALEGEQWFSSDSLSSRPTRQSVVQLFLSEKLPPTFINSVVDIRSSDGLQAAQKSTHDVAREAINTIVRVNRIVEKNLVNGIVRAWIRGAAASPHASSALFLCDLGRYQAIDTVWVVEHTFQANERMKLPSALKQASIFIVTEDLCCTELKVTSTRRPDGQYKVTVSPATSKIDMLEDRLAYLLKELRICDSAALWTRISELNSADMSLNPYPVLLQDVEWPISGKLVVMPHYVNFAVLAQDEEAAKHIRRSLRRLLALFSTANAYALDQLATSSLHDAKKWLISPPKDTNERVLVGTFSVTGSTLSRYRRLPKTRVVGIVDCMQTPYFKPHEALETEPHLAALLWSPELPTATTNPPKYRRFGKSSYVERYDNPKKNVTYYEPFYSEIDFARLIKVGHWSHGDRHGLLEINAEIAIEQSSSSESGAITWLVNKVAILAKERPVVIAFPVDKLAYRLAHHIKSRLDTAPESVAGKVVLLPLVFMPRFAGGLTRFAPLVRDSAEKLAKSVDGKDPIAVFLDYGFISNRTWRHAARQLKSAGFKAVQALGLLNRSSAPELETETDFSPAAFQPSPEAYWRWNVPVFGTGLHCALCASLQIVGRLRRLVEDSHLDLISPLEDIAESWRVRDISDFWEDFGMHPLPISDALGAAIKPPMDEITSSQVYTSSTLTARAIEYLRATGDIDAPLKIAQALIREGARDHAVELLCTLLLLAGGSLAAADQHDCVALLSKTAVHLLPTTPDPGQDNERRTCLLGLVAIVFAMQTTACKLATLSGLVQELELVDITDAPTVRLALMALATDSDASTDVQSEFDRLCMKDKSKRLLKENYYSLRPIKGSFAESWDRLAQALGRSENHSQYSAIGTLRGDFERYDNAKVIPHIDRLASLLAQCDRLFVQDCLGLEINDVLRKIATLRKMAQAPEVSPNAFKLAMNDAFNPLSKELHNALVRYGSKAKSPTIYGTFVGIFQGRAQATSLNLIQDIDFTMEAGTQQWPNNVGDYLPLGGHISTLFGEIFLNIKDKSKRGKPPEKTEDFIDSQANFRDYGVILGDEKFPFAWIWFDYSKEAVSKGITVVIWTGLGEKKEVPEYVPKVTGLKEQYIAVSSRTLTDGQSHYFEIRVRIPSLATILGENV